MVRPINILLFLLLLLPGIDLSGQQVKGKEPAKANTAHKNIFIPAVYLGNSDYKGGPIRKNQLDTLLQAGLTAHDSLGNKYRVLGFDFTYAERKLYEDSVGNLGVYMDFASEHCFGNKLSEHLTQRVESESDMDAPVTIYDRIKSGDTLFFDHIKIVKYLNNSTVTMPDSTAIAGRGLKCIIMK